MTSFWVSSAVWITNNNENTNNTGKPKALLLIPLQWPPEEKLGKE
jgi:hypothetical protein